MFYRNFLSLCNQIGKSPSAVAQALGFDKSSVTRWKRGHRPTDANLLKIADYFRLTPETLLSEVRPQLSPENDLSAMLSLFPFD